MTFLNKLLSNHDIEKINTYNLLILKVTIKFYISDYRQNFYFSY